MTKRAKIGVYGASGRMGRSVLQLLKDEYGDRAAIAAAVDRENGHLDDLKDVDAIIDFSLPEGTALLLDWFEEQSGRMPVYICGTTGLTERHSSRLENLSDSTVVFHASNFSTGVAALSAILEFAAPMLKALSYSPEIIEMHHAHKLDAPSGTAKALSTAIDPENPESIEIKSIREGEVIGRHEVTFAGVADRIIIGHEASNRSLFARGAIEAALWLSQQPQASGMVTMASYFKKRFGG